MAKATRDGFGEQLVESAKEHDSIIALSADLAKATKLSHFAKELPDRFIECGIAECNAIGIASGMSEYGFKPFVASFASFLTGKYDPIRVSLAYSKAPVVLIGTHSGMAIGRDGVTQMGLEDISLMRALPNMKVYQPASYLEARRITKWLCDTELDSPIYMRLGRQSVEETLEGCEFVSGKAQQLRTGSDLAILSTGCLLPQVLEACDQLEAGGNLSASVFNFATIKPLDVTAIEKAAETGHVVTVEDHSIVGGFGSAVAEYLSANNPTKVTRIGLKDTFPESGKPDDLYQKYGLDVNGIIDQIVNSHD